MTAARYFIKADRPVVAIGLEVYRARRRFTPRARRAGAASRPDAALDAFAMTAMSDWPHGYYAMCNALPLAVVVLSELAVTAETLPLRLMGAGSTLRGALTEMERLGPLRDALLRPVVQLIAAQRRRRDLSSTELSPE